MKLSKLFLVLTLILGVFSLTACGGSDDVAGTEEVASAGWPAVFSEVPEFTASPIQNLQIVDEDTAMMEFQNVTEEQLEAYANELKGAGFTHETVHGNVFSKVIGDASLAVGWEVLDSKIELILLKGLAEEGLGEVVVQWPTELDGITPFQGYTPNYASMNPDGLVTVDYSDVTAEAIDAYRAAVIADGFEPYDLGTGVEAYAMVDAEGMAYIVVVNPQADVEGHLQISGIVAPVED